MHGTGVDSGLAFSHAFVASPFSAPCGGRPRTRSRSTSCSLALPSRPCRETNLGLRCRGVCWMLIRKTSFLLRHRTPGETYEIDEKHRLSNAHNAAPQSAAPRAAQQEIPDIHRVTESVGRSSGTPCTLCSRCPTGSHGQFHPRRPFGPSGVVPHYILISKQMFEHEERQTRLMPSPTMHNHRRIF